MAITANAIWETWPTSGSDTNGGGFDPSLTTNMATDLNCTLGTGNAPVVTSASYNFVAGDVGAWVFIASGTNWIPGWYKIASVASNAATLNGTIGTAILYNGATVQNTVAGCSTSATNTNGATWSIDYSQQATAQLALTGESSATTVITTTSAVVTVAMIGNACYITGTGLTTGRYFITNVNFGALTFTVDRSPGTTGTGVAANVGGALATLSQAFGSTGGVGSNLYWLKNTGNLSITTAVTSPPSGTTGAFTCLVGYNSVRGDLDTITTFTNFPTIISNNQAISLIIMNNAACVIRNIIFDAGSGGTKAIRAVNNNSANQIFIVNCKANGGFTTSGFTIGNIGQCIKCYATGLASGAFGFVLTGPKNVCLNCVATSNSCTGFQINSDSCSLINCVSANNSGASSDGVQCTAGSGSSIKGCSIYNNGRDGLRATAAGAFDMFCIEDNIVVSNGGFGINSTSTNYTKTNVGYVVSQNFNAFYNNTSGARNNFPTGISDVTLTGVPFTNAGSGDFSLNNTAGQGAACRAAGYPGTVSGISTTGYQDIGAVQHQDSGGGGGGPVGTNLRGGFCNG